MFLPNRVQGDTVTISAAEFQRMVYSAHLHTQMAEQPELDASLQVLLELQRRNPNANPAALAELSRHAVECYRTNAPAYLRSSGLRDEILAAYLEALRQVPARTNFVPADLQLLNGFMLQPDNYTTASPAELIHSGNQRLLSSEGEAAKRQALANACTTRAHGDAAFAAALDNLLVAEILCTVSDPPAVIIENTNSPLHENVTMQTLLALSAASGNGSLTVSSNQLMNLFAAETQALQDTIHTNLAVLAEFNQSQPDLLAYLTNQSARIYWEAHVAEVQRGQPRTITSATAAILVQSQLMAARDPLIKLPGQMAGVASGLHQITDGLAAFAGAGDSKLTKMAASGNMLSGALGIFDLFFGGESPEEEISREIGNVKTLIGDLSTNMNYRFDRVDQSLTTIFQTLNEEFSKIEIILDAQGRQTAHLNGSVDEIRASLVDVQTDLHRIERHLLAYVNQLYGRGLSESFNTYLGYEVTHLGSPMSLEAFNLNPEPKFFTHARDNAVDGLSAPYQDRDYSSQGLLSELTESGDGTTKRLDQNLSYIKKYLNDVLSQPTAGTLGQLANPRDWFVGAYAYAQLALENPRCFRQVNPANRLDLITARGRDLTNFFRSLTFSGPNLNSNLYTALENHYAGRLPDFVTQVSATEQQYANATNFALNTWRQWSVAAPRLTATATEALLVRPNNLIAGGEDYSLALRADGKIVGWGANDYGQTSIPAEATNVVAISVGAWHSLALRADGTVVAWGVGTNDLGSHHDFGQSIVPAEATNVMATAAGAEFSLALRDDGTVVGWGWNEYGQATAPEDTTNVTAIAAGFWHSLALRADRTVIGWGFNWNGETDVPAGLVNVIAIAAGAYHSLALREDGTIVAWGHNEFGQTSVPAGLHDAVAIAAGHTHTLALKSDGTVVAWGNNSLGQATVPAGLNSVVAIAAGSWHSLALKTDGTVVGWGGNDHGQAIPRGWLASPRVRTHLAAGENHSVALRADGTIGIWGANNYHQYEIPASATNVVAIAANLHHTLALRANRTVIGWGYNTDGQLTIPASATNVVAVSAGEKHSVALRADGTVVAWGWNVWGVSTVPADATNVVAIAAGYDESVALKADGTVISWGYADAIPINVTNVVGIAAGFYHQLALKADGTVVGWGAGGDGQISIPANATNVVAIAAGDFHSLALRADGTVVAWGYNAYCQATVPAGLSNVVAIAAGWNHSLALRADGTVVGWGRNDYLQISVPASVIHIAAWGEYPPCFWNLPSLSDRIAAVTAGSAHNLALTSIGSVAAWGLNTWGQTNVPLQAQSGIRAVASGLGHNLALADNGSVLAWGLNDSGQANVPVFAQSGVLAISAGSKHNLALKTDGTVIAWGYNAFGQTNLPASATNVVAIAAGCAHSLALKADGRVLAWGGSSWGQTNVPPEATNGVVAIAAGRYHNLALTSAGRVVAWGLNNSGQTNVPSGAQSGVVAIAAGITHSVALKADGTAVIWGSGSLAFRLPQAWTYVGAIAAGDRHSVLLSANTPPENDSVQTFSIARAQIPARVAHLFAGGNDYVLAEMNRVGALRSAAMELSGAKALLAAVLEFGLPYTLERDDVLHGFLYGSESLVDLDAVAVFIAAESSRLLGNSNAKPQLLSEVAVLRYLRFSERLQARLNDLRAAGQPEIPRLVGHTLRLLSLLRDAYVPVPPPALTLWSESGSPRLLLYGEPYVRYSLEYRDSLSVPGWNATTITNLRNEQIIAPPVSGSPQRFYRTVLPVP